MRAVELDPLREWVQCCSAMLLSPTLASKAAPLASRPGFVAAEGIIITPASALIIGVGAAAS
jgi:hypothetical protein